MLIALAIITISTNFNVYLAGHTHEVEKHNDLSQEMMSQLAEVYNAPNWEHLQDEIVNTEYGDLTISYEFQGATEFDTNKLEMTFENKGNQEVYSLERSVYYEQ